MTHTTPHVMETVMGPVWLLCSVLHWPCDLAFLNFHSLLPKAVGCHQHVVPNHSLLLPCTWPVVVTAEKRCLHQSVGPMKLMVSASLKF